MATKTFKLGEVCKGGVITAIATKTQVTIIAKEWDFNSGSKKGSSQANAKEFNRIEVNVTDKDAHRMLSNFLHNLTTSYHSEEVLDWCKRNSDLTVKSFW